MPHVITPRSDVTPRRGMLLLLVIAILALFVVVGAVGILLALRARDSARAFAAAAVAPSGSTALARAQLDEALLRLIRGGTASGSVTESLLQDKYGTSGTCSVTAATAVNAALVQVTTSLNIGNPAEYAGRVITFVPASNDPTGPASYRIVRADKGTGTLWLANVRPSTPMTAPTVFPCRAVVNGREFSGVAQNEPADAFDDQNPFLTNSGSLVSSRVQQVTRPAFGSQGQTCTVDNDGDGVSDGIWLADVLPPQRTPDGGQMSFAVSYLVLDLDGRINVNAHGSFVRAQAIQSGSTYPKNPATVPIGMGYGPADVDAARVVAPDATADQLPTRYVTLLQGGAMTQNAVVSSTTQWRPTPQAGATQAGRYGLGSGVQPGGSAVTGTNPLNSDAWLFGNSPTDLKSRLQVFTQGGPPTLTFFRPTPWGNPDTDDVLGAGTAAHPYRMRIDDDGPRAAGTNASDAIYGVAELERLLRQFDADAATLSPRLAAMFDDLAERSRMTVTTDSWDTPAITGAAATTIQSAAGGYSDPNAVLSPETVAGLRLDLNRPITNASRQELFRHLFTLLVALGLPANDSTAQWAANVIEFRDPDSIMTWYPFDLNPADGWTPGATGVWGAERPEMAITEASVSGNQATVSLYRPWAASCTSASGTAIPTERIDASLGSVTANTLDATRMSGTNPVWQLSVGGTTGGLDKLLSSATAVGTNTSVGQVTLSGSSEPTQVVLRRLANPSAARDTNPASASYNDYVPVHVVTAPTPARTVSRWLHWPNRDLVSHAELLTVQSGSAASLAEAMFDKNKESSLANADILDATIVPSRFVGAAVSVANGNLLSNVGMQNFAYGQFSKWREAGRVNVNTILPNTGNTPAALDNAVWTALVGPGGPANPVTSGGDYTPIQSVAGWLNAAAFRRTGSDADSGFLERSTAMRLANAATTRSHVFAVWITLRMTDDAGNTPRYARLFAIVDRSIPVGYQPGCNHNVRETIRLQRFLP
jgi:hypothetical protein